MRLPTPRLTLEAVGDYFGVPKVDAIANGLDALGKYHELLACEDLSARAKLKHELLDYNRGDLDRLAKVLVAMQSPPEEKKP